MKWTTLAICAALVATAASSALADYPTGYTGQQLQAPQMRRSGVFNPLGWWTKYGEPVSAPAHAAGDLAAEAGTHVEPATFSHYGYDYVYGPGSCECAAPCVNDLWTGYYQHPRRCGHHKMFDKLRGCGHCCDTCGPACGHVAADCGCGAPVPACDAPPTCAAPPSCAAPPGCAAPPACGCEAIATCTSCCKPRKSWFAHWQWGKRGGDSCSLGCGCATPVDCGCAAPPSCATPPGCGCAAPAHLSPSGAPEAPRPTADDSTTFNSPVFRRPIKSAGYTR